MRAVALVLCASVCMACGARTSGFDGDDDGDGTSTTGEDDESSGTTDTGGVITTSETGPSDTSTTDTGDPPPTTVSASATFTVSTTDEPPPPQDDCEGLEYPPDPMSGPFCSDEPNIDPDGDVTPPELDIIMPEDGMVCLEPATFPVAIRTTDDRCIDRIMIYVNGELGLEVNYGPTLYEAQAFPAGDYLIEFEVFDIAGNGVWGATQITVN
jgi:hypothetical protein